jgi:hypothetical protein
MQPTLDEALSALFVTPNEAQQPEAPKADSAAQSNSEIDQERRQLKAAQKALDALKLLLNGKAPAGTEPHP